MLRPSRLLEHRHSTFGNLVILLFVCAQAADGVFTYVGVSLFGPSIEGNPLLAWLIHSVGPLPALAAAKLTAIGLGSLLHLMTVHRIVALLAGFYLLTAVGPWVHLLFFSALAHSLR